MIEADRTVVIYRSPAFAFTPSLGGDCIRVPLAEVYPYPDDATPAQRKTVDFIRGWLHPDTLRRESKNASWYADAFDEYLHLPWMLEVGKAWFVSYLDAVRARLGPVPDDDAD